MAGSGLFTNIKAAKMSGNFTYVTAGNYWMRINKIVWDQTRTKEQFVSIIMTVLKVFPSSETMPPHRQGEEVNHYMEITGNEYFLADMKGFVAGAFGVTPEEVTEELADQAIANGGALMIGMVVEMNNKMIITQKGKPFTKARYARPVPPREVYSSLTPEEMQKFFPPGFLERQMQMENQQGLKTYQQAQAANPAAQVSWNPPAPGYPPAAPIAPQYAQAPVPQHPQVPAPQYPAPAAPAPYPFPQQQQAPAPLPPQYQQPAPAQVPQQYQQPAAAPMPPQYAQQPMAPAPGGYLPPR